MSEKKTTATAVDTKWLVEYLIGCCPDGHVEFCDCYAHRAAKEIRALAQRADKAAAERDTQAGYYALECEQHQIALKHTRELADRLVRAEAERDEWKADRDLASSVAERQAVRAMRAEAEVERYRNAYIDERVKLYPLEQEVERLRGLVREIKPYIQHVDACPPIRCTCGLLDWLARAEETTE